MPPRQRATGKQTAEGASTSNRRGAQHLQRTPLHPHHHPYHHPHHHQQQQAGGGTVTGLLRSRIMNRRQEQGLDHIQVNFVDSVSHELTPEELERRERRKEQNRRAARRCRQKKRKQQTFVSDNHAIIVAENQRMEQEIRQLRAEKASLERILDDHMKSGQCRQIKLEAPDLLPASPAAMASSPSSSSLSSVYSPGPVSAPSPNPNPNPNTNPNTNTNTNANTNTNPHSNPNLEFDVYLQDVGTLLPNLTFTDLNFPDLDVSVEDFASLPPPPDCSFVPLPPPSSSLLAGDPMANLKGLMPAGRDSSSCNGLCLHGPVSPVGGGHDRLSVSSVASDLSALSDHSQGFLVPGSVGPTFRAPPQAGGSETDTEMMNMNCSAGGDGDGDGGWLGIGGHHQGEEEEDDDEDDDVFRGDHTTTVTSERAFQRYL